MRSASATSRSCGGLLDQGDDVALAQDPAGHAAGVEHVQGVDLLAGAQELDRQAGDVAHRQRRAAPAVAVGAGQDQAGQRQALVEGLGRAHGVLAGQAVGDQDGLGRRGDAGDFRRLAHHRLVQGGAAGGVEDQDVVAAQLGGGQGALGDVGGALAGDDRQALDLDLLGQHGQLFHGGRAAGVERGDQHLLALELVQPQGQLAGGGGLARALQAGHQDHRRRVQGQVQAGGDLAAQHVDQAVIDDLDHLVGRLDRADDRFAGSGFLGLADEVLDHRQGDVGFQQGDANFAQRLVDVLLGQHAATAEAVEDP
jgi:hypothetical protein